MVDYKSGPLVGVNYEPRLPRGVLLVNTEADEVIVYTRVDSAPTTTFEVKGQIEKRDRKKSDAAADDPNFDVLAYDESRMGEWSL